MVVESVFNHLLAELDDKFTGLDQCIRKLHEIVKRFIKSREGGSAVVVGPKSSGKRSIISKEKKKARLAFYQVIMDYADDMEVVFIDGLILTNDTDALKVFDKSETSSDLLQFIIVFNFDQFVRRGRQTLLYTLLNASRSGSVFVLCVSSRQDCTELLEKRVRSRLSNAFISFTQSSVSFDDFTKAFATFLYTKFVLPLEETRKSVLILWNKPIALEDCEISISEMLSEKTAEKLLVVSIIRQFLGSKLNAFIANECVQRKLRQIYDETRSYCILKQITATFLCFMDAEHIESLASPHASRIFIEAKNAVIANEDTMKSIILSLTLRQLCLLLCCVRLVRYQRRQDFTFREIILDYRKLVNKYLPMLNVKDDLILLKELDTLCSLTVLEERNQCGQLLFRRTSLQVDIDLVLDCVKEFTPFPTALMHWIDELEK